MKRILWPLALAFGLSRLAPIVLKRTLAPPQRPQPHTPAELGLPEIDVELASRRGTALRGWLVPVAGRAPGLVVLHGWGGNASLMLPLAVHLHRAGFHALFLDARNHGRSEHDDFSSMPRFAEDLEVALDWLAEHDSVTRVGVIGHSVGAGAALLVGSRNTLPRAIVSVSAFAHPGRLMAANPPLANAPNPVRSGVLRSIEKTIGHPFDEIAPEATVSRVTAPLLLVHGEADTVVPVSDLYELASANPDAQVLLIPGADHASLDEFEPYIDAIIGFLAGHLTD